MSGMPPSSSHEHQGGMAIGAIAIGLALLFIALLVALS